MHILRNGLTIVLGLFLIGILALRGTKSKEEIIKDYMKDKYKEEFIIELMGKRNSEVRAEVLPKKYIGTIRQYDSYYSSTVFMPPYGEIGDNYGAVLLKESANEYFRPKLEELFGKNILPVLTLEGGYDFSDFKKEMEKRQMKFKERPNGVFSPLSGGIYIFGRVESEADREYYRKQIYEFIQYLKAENMFDYINIEFHVKDERMLSKGFNENIEDRNKIIAEKNFVSTKTRGLIYQKYEDDFKNTPQEYINNHLNNIRKSNVRKETYFSDLLYLNLLSEKLIKSRGWDKNDRINAKIKTYSNLNEVEFNLEGWSNQE